MRIRRTRERSVCAWSRQTRARRVVWSAASSLVVTSRSVSASAANPVSTAVRTSARQKDESIRAAFEKTLSYNAQIAKKAAKTRRKNAEADGEGAPEPEVEAPKDGAGPAVGSGPVTP